MYEAAVYGLLLSLKLRDQGVNIDPYKTTSLIIVHDIAEAYTGDIIKWVSLKLGKIKREIEAIRKHISIEEIIKLVEEYYEGVTLESRVAKIADLLATLTQARRYMRLGFNVNDIYERVKKEIADYVERYREISSLKEILDSILTL